MRQYFRSNDQMSITIEIRLAGQESQGDSSDVIHSNKPHSAVPRTRVELILSLDAVEIIVLEQVFCHHISILL